MANVKVYSTPTCPYCIRAKSYLKDHGVLFENHDVSADQNSLHEMVEISGQMGVPVIWIDGDIIVGFDEAKIKARLGLA